MKTYLTVVALLALLACLYGFAIPSLLSLRSTLFNLIGLVLSLTVGPCLAIYFFKKHIKPGEKN